MGSVSNSFIKTCNLCSVFLILMPHWRCRPQTLMSAHAQFCATVLIFNLINFFLLLLIYQYPYLIVHMSYCNVSELVQTLSSNTSCTMMPGIQDTLSTGCLKCKSGEANSKADKRCWSRSTLLSFNSPHWSEIHSFYFSLTVIDLAAFTLKVGQVPRVKLH